jgi:hypothetical protein
MVIAAMIAFAILLVAWIFAPSEGSSKAATAPTTDAIPVTA